MTFSNLPKFTQAYVVSDLHIGGDSGFQMFSEGEAFKALCERVAREMKADTPTLLVINGDLVDFLAEDGATYWNGKHAVGYLTAISERPELKPVFEGLRAFVARANAKLVITLGNHDLELALPDVKAKFIELVTDGVESRSTRVEFAFDGWGYRFCVGDAVALATHGNEVDEYNFTRYDLLQQIIREETLFGRSEAAQGWKPNAGTVLVIDAMNRIKKQHPFVDLLKPEFPVAVLALAIISPSNLSAAEDAARVKAMAKLNEWNRPASERRFLGGESPYVEAPPSRQNLTAKAKVTLLEDKVNEYLSDPSRDIDDMIYQSDDDLLGFSDWYQSAKSAVASLIDEGVGLAQSATGWVVDKVSEAGRAAHASTLRNALKPFINPEAFHVGSLDAFDLSLDDSIRDAYDVVFAGHTHTRRFAPRSSPNRGHFVNTGTWAGLMRLTPENVQSGSAFDPIYDLMVSGDRQALLNSQWISQERPVAVMKQTGNGTLLELRRVADDGKLESVSSESEVIEGRMKS